MSGFQFEAIRHLLIDLDGVLYRGQQPLPHAQEFISWLKSRRLEFRLVSNNATMTPAQYSSKLRAMGIGVTPSLIFTSAIATAAYLKRERQADRSAFVIGQEGLLEALETVPLRFDDESVDWVIVGLDRTLSYDKLAKAALLIESGAKFLGTNPDTSFPTERGLEPGAGAILAALNATTGKDPLIIGKPQPLMVELALQQMGARPESTVMLGDRLDTDILAGNRLNIPSVLVLTGVSKERDIPTSGASPSLVVAGLKELVEKWESRNS